MKLLHTSDWHLGHTLHDVSRQYEHEQFIAWLLDTLEAEACDALVVTGDIFDSANPPAAAQQMWYGFLAEAHRRVPALDVVVIGGNHDSAARLEAPGPVLAAMRVTVIGGLPRDAHNNVDTDRLAVPLHDASGAVAAWVAAVPFLRPADLPRIDDDEVDPLIEGVRRIYAEAIDAARRRCAGEAALIATGHCFMVSGPVEHLSERRILGGHQHALPSSIFPDDVTYAALGHLHKAQRIAKRDHVRYAGSPIPLAMGEANYKHQVVVVETEGAALTGVRSVPVPQPVELLRLPKRGAAPMDELDELIAALPEADDAAVRPFLEVVASLPAPEPKLRQKVEAALDGKQPRLVKLTVEYTGDGATLADHVTHTDLKQLDPLEVFVRRYRRDHDSEPSPALIDAFHEVLAAAHQQEGS